ncbi:4-hydroxybenzoate solanesyltransferase [Synechococcus elongatus]|uniref:4-hydroxybenzoate solanesyltransferase n=1 Tax=Synechococcus elongatus PCC 11801 TaxID=2219813 RepID=A0AAN1QP79_SYNEL|nr:4-hydroxybenzoate solanesyltransferase [Synechococcus elongatus]AZB72832.1 4-hydroxybenzoate octaprenyltransferase [Synechococcus elongatus PCC 11801]
MSSSASRESTWLAVIRLLRWDKPAGRLILLIPALWAVVLASAGRPDFGLLLVIVSGGLAASAAGCVINDLWDRNLDPRVERTKQRPLASRRLSTRVGAIAAIVSLVAAWGLSQFLTPLGYWLCVAAVPVIVLYPGAKRVFPVPQLVLAIAWGFSVLISWAAVQGELQPATAALWAATLFWTLGFDTVYALADREDDIQVGIQSSARFFGDLAPQAIAACYLLTSLFLAWTGVLLNLHPLFWLTWGGATGLWVYQSWRLREPLPRSVYSQIFAENVSIGLLVLTGFWLGVGLL